MNRKFTDQELIRRAKLKELQDNNKNPYEIEKIKRTHTLNEFHKAFDKFSKDELEKKSLKDCIIAGRLMAVRQTFGVIQDFDGRLQTYINKKTCDPETFATFKKADIGDIIKIIGVPMKTHTDELTIKISKIAIASKALKPLPEKFHGLIDEELRARNRYVDLIINEESKRVFIARSKIISSIRKYMDEDGFLEVETPVLQPILGGAAARPFVTHHNALDRDFYLRVATEIPLKKIIVGGFEKIYEIGRIFRNEGMDATHNPEFTTMEAYVAYAGMEEIMDVVEGVIRHAANEVNKTMFKYRGFDISFGDPFKKVHMVDIVKDVTGIDFNSVGSIKEALKIAKDKNVKVQKHQETIGHILNLFFEEFCEEKLIQPTFVWGHPIEVSPLAKKDYTDTRYTKRFELFIGQKEFANAFAELNDPIDQYERFDAQLKEKNLGNDEANEMDIDFIEALEYGLPPTGGLGLGIDRLVMLLTEKDTIRNVLLFPHMKDKK